MKLVVTKVCRAVVDTTSERQRISKAFRKDPETRKRLTLLMDAIEARDWQKAIKLLAAKWWSGRDKRQECPRCEFIGLMELRRAGNPKAPAPGFDLWANYADLVFKMAAKRKPGDVEYTVEEEK
jgi:hypothetical protein